MKQFSRLNERFEYLGKPMPMEFKEVCKDPEFKEFIENRDDEKQRWRFFNKIVNYLKYDYQGTLPRNPGEIARTLMKSNPIYNYPDYICDLFDTNINESEYKEKHPEEYANFFDNLDYKEKKKRFVSADWGGRSIIELEQDVKCGNLIEDMISFHTNGILLPNKEASNRNGGFKTSTKCDFIYKNPVRPGYKQIEVPVELKTKWFDDDVIQIRGRGTVERIRESEGGMILVIYPKTNKAILIDTTKRNTYEVMPGYMKAGGKPCDDIHIKWDAENAPVKIDFKFWDTKNDVKKLMHMIYDQYESRETK